MMRSLPLIFSGLLLLALVACHPDEDNQRVGFHGNKPPAVKPTPTPTTQVPDADDTAANATPPPPPSNQAAPPTSAPPTPKVDYPYGVPVQGKAGYVTSPYAPDSGYVDVRGFAPGQEVRDPYTGKVFLVP